MLRPADVLRAASALLDASSKATARKMENVGFIWASMPLNRGGVQWFLALQYSQTRPVNRCKQCNQPLVEIDHWNDWQGL